MTATITEHGYNAYTYGCRCDTCRAAKRAYMAARRAEARTHPADRSAEDFTHGTPFGYEERGCRCESCANAYKTDKRRQDRQRPGVHYCRDCRYRHAQCCCPGIGPRGGAW